MLICSIRLLCDWWFRLYHHKTYIYYFVAFYLFSIIIIIIIIIIIFFFQVYRISLVAKTTYHTYLFHQLETSAIVGTFQREVFLPNEKYIYSLTDNLMDQLMKEANGFFDDF